MNDTSTSVVALAERQPRSVLVDMSSRYGMEAAAFEATLRATVCKGNVSREEFAAFLLVAKEYGLNPMTKELYAFPAKGGGIQPIVSIDGWSRIINDHPMFDGMDFEDVREGDDLIAVTCRMHRKDRSRSIEATEYMSECRRSTDVWKTWPRRMLRHKAMIQCARYAFGFSGIVDPDECERQMTVRDVTPAAPNLAARLATPADGPREGFTAVHAMGDDDIPDFDADPPREASEQSGPDTAPDVSGPDAILDGCEPSEDETAAGAERDAAPAVDVLSRVDTVIADMEFKTLAELKTMKADRRFAAFVAAVRAQDADAADRVEKALAKTLESFG
jgi:phage recombination protein Bet